MPQGSSFNGYKSIEYGLVDTDVLQLHGFPAGFVQDFLKMERVSCFENLPPDLEAIKTSTILRQPFIPDISEKLDR